MDLFSELSRNTRKDLHLGEDLVPTFSNEVDKRVGNDKQKTNAAGAALDQGSVKSSLVGAVLQGRSCELRRAADTFLRHLRVPFVSSPDLQDLRRTLAVLQGPA